MSPWSEAQLGAQRAAYADFAQLEGWFRRLPPDSPARPIVRAAAAAAYSRWRALVAPIVPAAPPFDRGGPGGDTPA